MTECPYCKYKHGWGYVFEENDKTEYKEVKGNKGEFYDISNDICMEKDTGRYWENDKRNIKGCPSCGGIFMEI